jgi:hypothetical protein
VDSQALSQESSFDAEPSVLEAATELYAWRLEQLERAGYSREHADPLAQDDTVDLHRACDLLERGCPERTAFLIMA